MNRLALVCGGVVSVGVLGSAVLLAGPLDPPVGGVGSTFKTLGEVEPRVAIGPATTPGDLTCVFRITQPGSYYLTGPLAGASGKSCIEIASSDVTLDLCGFTVRGVAGSVDGVRLASAEIGNVRVRNGAVVSFGAAGLRMASSATGRGCRIEGITASDNGTVGIIAGSISVVDGCTATGNGQEGIMVNTGSTVTRCLSAENGEQGFGIGAGASISGCQSVRNGGAGFLISAASTISGCEALENEDVGIFAVSGCLVESCTVIGGGSEGIAVFFGCTVRGCVVREHPSDGIMAVDECQIIGNTVSLAGAGTGDGAAIFIQGSECRIEGNHCTNSDRGIDVDAADNWIVRNTCAINTTNWTIVANNVYGPIIDRTQAATGAVSGNAAPSALGSTDANANYSYSRR